MVARSWRILRGPAVYLRQAVTQATAQESKKSWLWPLGLVVVITVLHFSIDPYLMFWHDLLRRLYYIPIVWAVYQSGLRGGAVFSIVVGAIFTIHLVTGWGHHLGSQLDQVYDIIGYFAVGIGVGYVVDRARSAAVSVAQREWDISLRGVISAAIHELKRPKSEIRSLADSLVGGSRRGMWEYSIGLRLTRASDRLDDLRRDLAGIAKILASSAIITKPFPWALRFAKSPHLGGSYGFIVAQADGDCPPPPVWPISPQILDEVSRCLLEDFCAHHQSVGVVDLTVSGRDGSLEIEFCSNAKTFSKPERDGHPAEFPRGWVRMKLLELTWSRYNGTVARFEEGGRTGFRLTLHRPRVRLSAGRSSFKMTSPARRIQESNRAYITNAAKRRSQNAQTEVSLARSHDFQNTDNG